jgi:hypothetical protein
MVIHAGLHRVDVDQGQGGKPKVVVIMQMPIANLSRCATDTVNQDICFMNRGFSFLIRRRRHDDKTLYDA